MDTLAAVFQELNALAADRTILDYAIGGATATLFYTEPTLTYDVDVFVLLPAQPESPLVQLTALYAWAAARGFPPDREHLRIHGVPVQFLPAHNALTTDAIRSARTLDYADVSVRVIGPEHLAAIAFEAGGAKRRERGWRLLDAPGFDREVFDTLCATYGIPVPDAPSA